MLSKITLLLVIASVIALVAVPAGATTWNYAADFSWTVNPAGAWTYGAYAGDLSTFQVAPAWPATGGAAGAAGVYWFWVDESLGNPCPGVIVGQDMDYPTDNVNYEGAFLPVGGYMGSPNNTNKTVARWTAPDAGIVQVDAMFTGGLWSGNGSNSDVWVILNGTPLLADHIEGFNGGNGHPVIGTDHTATYSGAVTVAAGDTVDFVVGNPGTRAFPNDALGRDQIVFSANVATVPEPSALAALMCGLGGVAGAAVRRRRS